MKIKYFEREMDTLVEEKVYGERAVDFIYKSWPGRLLWPLISLKIFNKLYGFIQSSRLSTLKVKPFVKKFNINLDEFELGEGGNKKTPYKSFNDFFIRKFKPNARKFVTQKNSLPAFCEARYLGWSNTLNVKNFPVKGKFLSSSSLLQSNRWEKVFDEGPVLIARLCPTDYHRFHFPDDGKIIDMYGIHGPLHSVNPIAFKYKQDILCTNERVVSILETKNFGKLAYIEVGATCVGKIVQKFGIDEAFSRGQEKGYFLFGGSTVILLGEKGAWVPSNDILKHSEKKFETWIKLGDEVATKV